MIDCVVTTVRDEHTFFTNGILGLTDESLAQIARAISDNPDVTSSTLDVWVSGFDRHITVGDMIVRMIGDTQYVFRLMGFNHYELASPLAYGEVTRTGRAGLLFQLAACLPKLHPVASRSVKCFVWKDSSLRKVCDRVGRELPDETQAVVKEVRIPVAEGESVVYEPSRLFVPSEYEVFGCSAFARLDEGVQYAWYAAHDNDRSRVKQLDDWAEWWWTRSVCDQLDLSRSPDFCRVSIRGSAGSDDPAHIGGIALCLCI